MADRRQEVDDGVVDSGPTAGDEVTDGELDVLLIEDNPGDARLIEEMLADAGELHQRVEGDALAAGDLQLHHERRLSDGLDRIADGDPDVILLDLGLPESTGLDTLDAVTETAAFQPIVVLTGLDDEQIGLEAIQRGAHDYLVKSEVTSDLLVRSIHHAIERNRQERERTRQLEQLESLNRLNRISQDITHSVITTTSRGDLEHAVCERLVADDGYRFAWIGTVEPATDRIDPSAAAGFEDGYLDEITISVDDESAPAARAVRTKEVQVVGDVQSDLSDEGHRTAAAERGYGSGVWVPIVHEDLLFGVLAVYAASPDAFSEREVDVLTRLGDVVGHAITAIERRAALVSDAALALEFRATGVAEPLVELSAAEDAPITFENIVRADDVVLAYGRSSAIPEEALREAASETEAVDELRVISAGTDQYEFELVSSAVTNLADAVATHGGQFTTGRIADGEFRFVVEFPPGRERRRLVELVGEHCPEATLIAQRLEERPDREVTTAHSLLERRLTDKQWTAVEVAYYGGFFDWPRGSTGQEIADSLGIAPATFTQHVRTAERKFFEAVFQDEE